MFMRNIGLQLSSVMLFFPKFLAGFSGIAVERIGYDGFFLATAALGVPVVFLVALAGRARKHLVAGGNNSGNAKKLSDQDV